MTINVKYNNAYGINPPIAPKSILEIEQDSIPRRCLVNRAIAAAETFASESYGAAEMQARAGIADVPGKSSRSAGRRGGSAPFVARVPRSPSRPSYHRRRVVKLSRCGNAARPRRGYVLYPRIAAPSSEVWRAPRAEERRAAKGSAHSRRARSPGRRLKRPDGGTGRGRADCGARGDRARTPEPLPDTPFKTQSEVSPLLC